MGGGGVIVALEGRPTEAVTPTLTGPREPLQISQKEWWTSDRAGTALSGSAQVQMVLEQLAEQVPAAGCESGLELVMGERPGLLAEEEADEGAVDGIRATEGVRCSLAQRARRSRDTSCANPVFASSSRRFLATR